MTIDQLKAWIDANIDTNGTSAITGSVMNTALTNIVETFIRLSQQGQLAEWSDTTEYVPLNFAQYVYYDGAVYRFVSLTADTGTAPGTDTDVWVVSNPYDLIHVPNTDFNLQVYKKEVEISGTDLDLTAAGAANFFEIITGTSITTFTMNEGDNLKFWLQNKTVASIVIAASSLIMLKGVDAITLRPDDIVEFTAIGSTVYLNDDSIGSRVIRDGEKIIMGEGADTITIGLEEGGLRTKYLDPDTNEFRTIDEIKGQFRTKQILPVMSDYACYSDDGGTQSGTVTAGNDELIDIIKIIGSDYFAIDNSVITVQNLPIGYYALIEVIVELNLTKTGGTGLESGVEIARLRGITTANYYNAFKLSGDYQIVTKMFTFNIANGDQITFNIKNFDASDFNYQILNFYSRMNIVATEPIL